MSLLLFIAFAAGVQDAPAAAPAKPEKKMCRSETPTGSMMPKRTCHTKSEWEQIDAANQQNVDAMSRERSNASPR